MKLECHRRMSAAAAAAATSDQTLAGNYMIQARKRFEKQRERQLFYLEFNDIKKWRTNKTNEKEK